MSQFSVNHAELVAKAKYVAAKIVDGKITPFDGATLIVRECHLKSFPGDHTFDPFVYWQDEYEDAGSDERRAECADIIRRYAHALLGGPAVVLNPEQLTPSISPSRRRD